MPVDMRDSDTYLAIMDEGAEKQAKKTLLRLGEQRFGAPEEAIRTQMGAINDLDRLDRLSDQLLRVRSWQELLDTP
jgi:hypothetical protein